MKTQTDTTQLPDALRDAGTIVAYTDEEGRHDYVRRAALEAARRDGARLILYPLEMFSPLSNPLPNEWSSERERSEFGDPLSVSDLELLGREWLAAQVLEATQSGVEAGAGLPEEAGVQAMVDYARNHDAAAVLLPREALDKANPIDHLLGRDTGSAEDADRERDISVLLVDRSGTIEPASHHKENS